MLGYELGAIVHLVVYNNMHVLLRIMLCYFSISPDRLGFGSGSHCGFDLMV